MGIDKIWNKKIKQKEVNREGKELELKLIYLERSISVVDIQTEYWS